MMDSLILSYEVVIVEYSRNEVIQIFWAIWQTITSNCRKTGVNGVWMSIFEWAFVNGS